MKDLFEKRLKNMGPLGMYKDIAEGFFIFPKLTGQVGNRMHFYGKEVITWSVNNYLGLANHPEVRKVDAQATEKYGLAYPMGARMMSGQTELHEQLEQRLAEFVEKEAAYLLNFGYQGVVSIIDALVDKDDVIVYDVDSHACIVDGVRLHPGKRFAFRHNDVESLEINLQRATNLTQKTKGAILVISEGVFGMRGTQGIIKEIVALKKKFKFRFFVDDAHGFGVLGKNGMGTGSEQKVQKDIDLYFSTFAKAMAATGAFVAGDKSIIDFLRYNMRSQIFAKSLKMVLVEGAIKRLELLSKNNDLRDRLWTNVRLLQSGLKQQGFDIGTTASCITPVYLSGSLVEVVLLTRELRETYGIFCSIVIYPIIPKGMVLLRLIPTAVHTKQDIDTTIKAFVDVRNRLQSGEFKQNLSQVLQLLQTVSA
ncbi:MAG: aminotransferase class I/II-fold pyridoxal phosphate-dependent enzyme [Flavobacteriaceae bacterium]|nr:aminotransferase class I/II-fold pyridoxal phosphate-dependent enzyme [Flavobacteriaceae bacterium]MCY4266697.1 aminotransferase class I/II-fold pyridoxal phosphate-dependent enzyme [Flavobacteriaceae bacterium]MCY4299716.1 aminotransferase class I/II-fold pyridoxal phosphate-dependent enzyme [Flavobacteriaceae bacterium]